MKRRRRNTEEQPRQRSSSGGSSQEHNNNNNTGNMRVSCLTCSTLCVHPRSPPPLSLSLSSFRCALSALCKPFWTAVMCFRSSTLTLTSTAAAAIVNCSCLRSWLPLHLLSLFLSLSHRLTASLELQSVVHSIDACHSLSLSLSLSCYGGGI